MVFWLFGGFGDKLQNPSGHFCRESSSSRKKPWWLVELELPNGRAFAVNMHDLLAYGVGYNPCGIYLTGFVQCQPTERFSQRGQSGHTAAVCDRAEGSTLLQE